MNPPRTSEDLVKGVLLTDWGDENDLTPFIAAASALVDRVKACSVLKNYTLSDSATGSECELIERWLAAHLYVQSDQNEASKTAGKGSAQFQGQTGMALDASKYGQMAKLIDASGCLTNLEKRQLPSFGWLGGCR